MSYNGSGTFTINSTGQPVVAGTVITASAFNALTTDLATGLTTAITKDGQTTTTARITFAQGITSSLTTDSSSVSTGSIITDGGVGIAKNLYVGGTLNVTGSTSLTNPVINNIKMGYTTTATAAGTTTLTVASNYRQFFTGTLAQTIVLPVTSTLVTGIAYEIENNSTGLLTVNSSGGNLVGTVPAGVCAHAVCIGTTLTTAADWDWDYISTTTITGTGANVLGTAPTIASANLTTALTLTGASGTSGQYLTSGGSGVAPTWSTVASSQWTTTGSDIYYNTGKVGIGTTSPAGRLTISGGGSYAPSLSGQLLTLRSGAGVAYMTMGNGDGADSYRYIGGASATQLFGKVTDAGAVTEHMRIDSDGNLLVGTTNTIIYNTTNTGIAIGGGASPAIQISRNADIALLLNRLTSDGQIATFSRQGTTVGNINVTTTATAYNTSSDYRLKNTIAPMTGALAKVAQLKPVTYKWKADGSDGEGFIAHELAEVCPHAVSGAKDAIDEDGNPQYQGIDVSFLVATLTAALQEQQALIVDLQARLAKAGL
jgi:hypothetical protein